MRSMPTGIVTGASRGLGLALARALDERGWRLSSMRAAPRRSPRPPRACSGVTAIAGRRRRPGPPRALVEAAGEPIDLVVNNASLLGPSPQPALADYPLDDAPRACTRRTSSAPLALLQLALPRLREGAAILDITSDAGVEAYEGWGGYGSSKAALEQLTADPRRRAPRPARLLGRPGRHAHPDAPGRLPGRGHLGPPAARGQRARPARPDRGLAAERPLPGQRGRLGRRGDRRRPSPSRSRRRSRRRSAGRAAPTWRCSWRAAPTAALAHARFAELGASCGPATCSW